MIMYATEFEGETERHSTQIIHRTYFLFFAPYVCVDEWIECREEVAQDWIRDMKSSDYSALKEKVVSLEEGLRVIGLAQVRIKDCII